jgi:hypothetical protein
MSAVAFYLACTNISGFIAPHTLIPIAGILAYDVMNSGGKGIQEGSGTSKDVESSIIWTYGVLDGGGWRAKSGQEDSKVVHNPESRQGRRREVYGVGG